MTTSPLQGLLLGVIQGLTEFFPISSSGHLVLAQEFLGISEKGVLMEVLLHAATVIVVGAFYRRDIGRLLTPTFDAERNRERYLLLIALVPTVIAGLFFRDFFARAYEEPRLVLGAMFATGVTLLATRFARRTDSSITLPIAIVIGIAQSFAILPGISRSGATIATALFFGVRRPEAARFSFLLSVPAILGATIVSLPEVGNGGATIGVAPLIAGAIGAAVAGFLALRLLVQTVISGRFDRWGWYCLVAAIVGIVLIG